MAFSIIGYSFLGKAGDEGAVLKKGNFNG